MATFLLFALMLVFMLMRVYVPVGSSADGKVQKVLGLSFQEKSIMQRTNVYSIGLVLVLATASGMIANNSQFLIILFALAILAMPVRLILTSHGVAINRVVYRPWSDFTSYTVERRRIVLNGKAGTRSMNLSILGTHQAEVIPHLRKHLSEAKAGKSTRKARGDRGLALARN